MQSNPYFTMKGKEKNDKDSCASVASYTRDEGENSRCSGQLRLPPYRNYRQINRVITAPLMLQIGARATACHARPPRFAPDNGKYRYRGCNWYTRERVTRRCNSSAQLRIPTLNPARLVPPRFHRDDSASTVSRLIRRGITTHRFPYLP